jgi:RNA polymerase-associated protein
MTSNASLMSLLSKRSTMTFFTAEDCHYCHRVRIVLAEKGVTVDILNFDPKNLPQEVADINPYNSLPILVDRELVLFESKIIMEYLDERFPHPPLLPVYPVARGNTRQFIYRIEREWSPLVDTILANTNAKAVEKARKDLKEGLMGAAAIFADKPFFMSDEFNLADCVMAPILWRLPALDIDLPNTKQTKPLKEYMERLFNRKGFKASLTEREREISQPLPA